MKKTNIKISLIFLFAFCLRVQGVQILEQKVIAKQVTDCDMHQTKLIFDNNNKLFITMEQLLYTDSNLIRIGTLTMYTNDNPFKVVEIKAVDDYCCNFLGGFVKGNQFYIAFDDVNAINIYHVQKKPELVNYIEQSSDILHFEKVISTSQKNSLYLFGHYNTVFPNPLAIIITQGNFYYNKPLLAEISDNKIRKLIKFDYGGKTDESYIVQEIATGKDSINFFGFRNIDVPFSGKSAPIKLVEPYGGYGLKQYHFGTGDYYINRDITRSIILYYSDYNFTKESNTRKCKIYENTPGYNKDLNTYSDYGVLSADTQGEDVFAVFTWVENKNFKMGSKFRQPFNINDVNSSIYFWQCSDKSHGKAEKIAEGFCPLVRVDKIGNVRVFWVDSNGNVVQKVKRDGKWSNEEIVLNNFNTKSIIYTKNCSIADEDKPEAILYTKFFAAEFDLDNNLHAVYPTKEGIVYTKIKLE